MPVRRRALTYSRVLEEVAQGHSIRKNLYEGLERSLGSGNRVVAFFSSSTIPAAIEDADAVMLEEVLQDVLEQGQHLVLVLNSMGGEALPAERIVNICRSYSEDGFTVVIPKMAKSAATMVCFGAREIWMSQTSELGPVDPQIAVMDDSGFVKFLAAHEIVESYHDLLNRANRTRGRVDPYLQQLQRFDARDIRRIISAQQLSENIAVKCLQGGVFRGRTDAWIRRRIKPFLEPRYTKVHGRPIYHDVAKHCGLSVRVHELRSDLWRLVWQLYVRLNYLVSQSGNIAKVIESVERSYTAAAFRPGSVSGTQGGERGGHEA